MCHWNHCCQTESIWNIVKNIVTFVFQEQHNCHHFLCCLGIKAPYLSSHCERMGQFLILNSHCWRINLFISLTLDSCGTIEWTQKQNQQTCRVQKYNRIYSNSLIGWLQDCILSLFAFKWVFSIHALLLLFALHFQSVICPLHKCCWFCFCDY